MKLKWRDICSNDLHEADRDSLRIQYVNHNDLFGDPNGMSDEDMKEKGWDSQSQDGNRQVFIWDDDTNAWWPSEWTD